MKNKLLMAIATIFLFGSCGSDEGTINLDIPVDVHLVFVQGSLPVTNAEIRINTSTTDNFSFNQVNLFEGTTGQNGEVNISVLTPGQYRFRLSTALGYLYGSFIVSSNQNTTLTYDLNDYTSSMVFNAANAPTTKSGSYYLFPKTYLSYSDYSNEDIIANSVEGTLSNGVITFDAVLPDIYWLLVPFNNLMVAVEFDVRVSGQFNGARNTVLQSHVILDGETWNISETLEIQNNIIVADQVSSISFSGSTCTFTFVDNTVVNRDYSSSFDFGGNIVIQFNDRFDLHQPNVDDLLSLIVFRDDQRMLFNYDDDAFFTYNATLLLN